MGSPFASHTNSDPIPFPHDPPHTFIVGRLTGIEIEAAQAAHGDSLVAGDARHWAAKFRRILEGSISDKAAIAEAIRDPLTGFDRYALVRSGLRSWTYPLALTPPIVAVPAIAAGPNGLAPPAVPAYDPIADLDDETVDLIATEVLRLTKPALFLTTEEDVERVQKELPAAAPAP